MPSDQFCSAVAADTILPDRNDVTLELVREIGFDGVVTLDGHVVKVFFRGPALASGRAVGAHATESAILEFISYWTNQIHVAKDYLANGCNNKTTEWTTRGPR